MVKLGEKNKYKREKLATIHYRILIPKKRDKSSEEQVLIDSTTAVSRVKCSRGKLFQFLITIFKNPYC